MSCFFGHFGDAENDFNTVSAVALLALYVNFEISDDAYGVVN